LLSRGVRADLTPSRAVAESLVDEFPAPTGDGARVLVPRALTGRDVLPDGLRARGWEVDVLPVYRTVRAEPDPEAVARVLAGDVDAITFTSSSTVTNLCDVLGGIPDPQPLLVSIGPATSATVVSRGLRVDAEADDHTVDGVVDALLRVLGQARTIAG
jgi:uroporphyrinogen III methyltransferase / synthase